MDIKMRQLTDADYRSVKSIYRDAFDRTAFNIGCLNTSWYYRAKKESYAFILNGVFVGFMIASYHIRNKSNIYIDYIAFDKEYWGKGFGTFALKEMITAYKKFNRSVHLYPLHSGLWPWYERLGFKKTAGGYFNFHSYGTRSMSS